MGIVVELRLDARRPLTPLISGDANNLGGAEGVGKVHECNADVDFRGLAVGIVAR